MLKDQPRPYRTDRHSPTSVLPLETNNQTTPDFEPDDDGPKRWAQTAAQRRLHARFERERSKIIDALLNGDLPLARRAARIEGCCSHPSIARKPDGKLQLVLYACRDRMCPRCQVARGQRASRRIESIILAMNSPRKIELTVKHRVASLEEQTDRLYAALRELRKSKVWRQYVRGGVAVFEITINEKDRTWHPHFHIVYDGDFFPHKQLVAEWHRITTDSTYAFIKPVYNRKAAASYVGTYLSKSIDFTTLTAPELREYAQAQHGRRLVLTFGTSHAQNPDPKPEPHVTADDEHLINTHTLTAAADAGNERARKAVELLRGLSPTWASALGYLPYHRDEEPAIVTTADFDFIAEVCREVVEVNRRLLEGLDPADQSTPQPAEDQSQMLIGDFNADPPQPTRYT